MKKALIVSIFAVLSAGALSAALTETAVPALPAGVKELPEQTEPVDPRYKEDPYSENVPVPVFTWEEKCSGMMIFRRPLSEPVYPQTRPLAWERVESLKTFGAKGQIVTLNFAVYPHRALKRLRVTGTFPLPEGQIRQLAYWKVRYPSYQTRDVYRRVPTYLFPNVWCNAPALEPQQYVVNMRIPADAKPGRYAGKLFIAHDGFDKALVLPYTVDVLPFELQKDPRKNYSAYYYPVRSQGHAVSKAHAGDEKWFHAVQLKEFKLMVDYGFTRPPTLDLDYDKNLKKLYIPNWEKMYSEMKEAKLPVPAVIVTGCGFNKLYNSFTRDWPRPHLNLPKPLPPEFFPEMERLAKNLKKEWDAKKYPPIIIGPIDEPGPRELPIVKKIYSIFKKAGFRTFLTSCPFQAEIGDYVDFWSDQPFREFKEVQQAAKKEYWCYPNHNAYEIKDVATMTRGGRMTYGFGLWKSDYNFLIPWIWRYYFNEHLLTKRTGGGGCLLTDDGNIIVEYDWENFREGIYDGKYIYTLEQAIIQREPAKDPELKKLLAQGRALLQEIWDSIPAYSKYLAGGHWTDREFEGRRAQIAGLTARITRYPAVNRKTSPSIIIDPYAKGGNMDFNARLDMERKRGNLEEFRIPPQWFKACEKEAKVNVESGNVVHLHISVDHKNDGTGNKGGKYLCGWPRVQGIFPEPLDFNRYGFFRFRLKVDSNRDGQKAVEWPIQMDVRSKKKNAGARTITLPARLEPGEYREFLFSTSDLLRQSAIPLEDGSCMNMLQFWIREGEYAHGDELDFRFADLSLFGVKQPVVSSVAAAHAIQLPESVLPWRITLMGENLDGLSIRVSLSGANGRELSSNTLPAAYELSGILKLPVLKPGKYVLNVQIRTAGGKVLHEMNQFVTALVL